MVSAGDTAISLHIHPGPTQKPLTGGGGPDQPNPKWQDLSKSAWGGEEGWGGPDQLNPKCQDLSKFAFSGGAGGGWCFRPTFLNYLSGGTQRMLNQKFWKSSLALHHR